MQNNQTTYTAPQTPKYTKNSRPRAGFIVAIVIIVAVVIGLMSFPPYTTVPAGHVGIVTTFGKVENYTLSEGFHLKNPVQKVVLMDNRTQKQTLSLQAFSSDIQQVDVICSVNFRIDKSSAQTLFQTVGTSYYANVMEPRIQENVKAVFTRYNAEKIMEVRNSLSSQVMELLVPEMEKYGIVVESISIENVDFTDAFTNAVEEKQVAEQTKLRVQTEQAQLVNVQKSEAERRIIAAQADAEERTILANAQAEVARIEADAKAYAIKIQAEAEAEANEKIAASVTEGLIQYHQAERWNGQLPTVVTGDTALPILNLGDITEAAADTDDTASAAEATEETD